MSNQGQRVPSQLALISDEGAIVKDSGPYAKIRARLHFRHYEERGMTLCLVSAENMEQVTTRELSLGSLSGIVDCKVCARVAKRLEDVLKEELSTLVDGLR